MNWYVGVLKKYADFTGRARRTEFWMFALFNFIFSFALQLVEALFGGPGVLSGLYGLAVLLPGLAVGARRLHDTGRSGWWLLLLLVPVLGWIVLFVFAVLEGERKANAYGPDPKGALPAQPAGAA